MPVLVTLVLFYYVALSVMRLPLAVIAAEHAAGEGSKIDNVAVQWNALFSTIICSTPSVVVDTNIIFVQFQLAQWHALIAHKTTGSCTSQEIVVAYASHKVLANYFPFQVEEQIDPLLVHQLKELRSSKAEQKLGKQLGEAVALDLINKRNPGRESAHQALKDALDSEADAPRPGIYRYTNNTQAGRDAATFIFYNLPVVQPYVVPEPTVFIEKYLSHLKPPRVPSYEWDQEYEKLVNVGRSGWPGRTAEMNNTVALLSCPKLNTLTCWPAATWSIILRNTLPKQTSLYDTVTILAKLSVAIHDAFVVVGTLQYGFWSTPSGPAMLATLPSQTGTRISPLQSIQSTRAARSSWPLPQLLLCRISSAKAWRFDWFSPARGCWVQGALFKEQFRRGSSALCRSW